MEGAKKFSRIWPKALLQSPLGLVTGIYALVLAIYFWNSQFPLLVYQSQDQLTYLFAQGFHHHFTSVKNGVSFPPVQNFHLMIAALFYGIHVLPGSILFYLWITQTLLVLFFCTRVHDFLEIAALREWKWIVWLLLFLHPWLWIHLLFSPALVLTAAIFLQVSNLLHKEWARWTLTIWLMLLSFCGLFGFILSCFLFLFYGIFYLFKKIPSIRLLPFIGLIPSAMFYLFLTILWGNLGGSVLDGYPTLLTSITTHSLLNGYWSEQFLILLAFWGNGMLSFPYLFPLLGFISLLGIVYTWDRYPKRLETTMLFSFLIGGSWLLFGFAPEDIMKSRSLIFLPFLLLYAVKGMIYIKEEIRFSSHSFLAGIVILLLVLFTLRWPFEFQSLLEKKQYNSLVVSNIFRAKDWFGAQNPHVAVRFTPEIFSVLPKSSGLYPAGLQVRLKAHTLDDFQGGKALAAPPLKQQPFFYYATFEEASTSGEELTAAPWNRWIEDATPAVTMQNIKIFSSLSPVTSIFPFRDFVQREMKEKVQPVGPAWRFETNEEQIERIGIAMTPGEDSRRMEGFSSAGPGRSMKNAELGWMQSDPFPIEGDDFFLSAHMPGDATSSMVCLAVYQSSPIGKGEKVEQARHVFEFEPTEPLIGKTFYYINPQQLEYLNGTPRTIRGWRVVRLYLGENESGWGHKRWSLDPWEKQQAMWFAADRNDAQPVWIDALTQVRRGLGHYWNFEQGTYSPWTVTGTAFGEKPATKPYGNQSPIHGQEGNYFINSYHQGSDQATGKMKSPPFTIQGGTLRFRIGGGDDRSSTYVALVINDNIVKKASGERSERLRKVEWNLSPWEDQEAHIEIVDQSSSSWGHILADDFRVTFP